MRSAKYSTHKQGSPRQSWQLLASRRPVPGIRFFVADLSVCFLSFRVCSVFLDFTLLNRGKNISIYPNSEAFLSSAAFYKIMCLIHNTAILCYFWHFRLNLDKVTCELQAIKARSNFWFMFDFISKYCSKDFMRIYKQHGNISDSKEFSGILNTASSTEISSR